MEEKKDFAALAADQLADTLKSLQISEEKATKQSPTLNDLPVQYLKAFDSFIATQDVFIESNSILPEAEKTLIILSPLSLSHKFGRSWVTKSYLKSIVECPKRLLAVSLGISSAITLFPNHYTIKQCNGRSSLLSSHVLKIHGRDWIEKLTELCELSTEKLSRGEVEVPSDEWNEGDMYLTKTTIEALEGVVASVECAVDSIFSNDLYKKCFVSIRPPGHHSHSCTPSGFCLLNNAHIGIMYAHEKFDATHAVVLDFDLHHGDGTQDICWEQAGFKNEDGRSKHDTNFDRFGKRDPTGPKVGYFSLHDIVSFPTESGFATAENIKNASTCVMAHDLCIWNVHLREWKTIQEFDDIYKNHYYKLFEKAAEYLERALTEHQRAIFEITKHNIKSQNKNNQLPVPPPFKAVIVISAGFDGSINETTAMQRHKVNVPTSFYNRFTHDASDLATKFADGRLLSFLEGGYSDGALCSGVFSHLLGFQKIDWKEERFDDKILKDVIRGCKSSWKPTKVKQTNTKNEWINFVCELGRSMIPESVITDTADEAKEKHSRTLAYLLSSTRSTRSHSPLPTQGSDETLEIIYKS